MRATTRIVRRSSAVVPGHPGEQRLARAPRCRRRARAGSVELNATAESANF